MVFLSLVRRNAFFFSWWDSRNHFSIIWQDWFSCGYLIWFVAVPMEPYGTYTPLDIWTLVVSSVFKHFLSTQVRYVAFFFLVQPHLFVYPQYTGLPNKVWVFHDWLYSILYWSPIYLYFSSFFDIEQIPFLLSGPDRSSNGNCYRLVEVLIEVSL